jgi:ABC-type multidrug transport system fused ATPase/permease subunit
MLAMASGETERAIKRLWTYVRPYGWMLAISLALVTYCGSAGSRHADPYRAYLRHIAACVCCAHDVDTRNQFGFEGVCAGRTLFLVLLVVATAIKAIAEYGSVNAIAYLGQAVVRDLRNDVFDKILFQPLHFFHFNPTGELISRVSADVERIQTAASETAADFLKQTAILISLLVAIFIIDWRLAAVSLVLVPLVFYPTVWFGKRLRRLSKSNQQEMAQMANILYETLTGNRIVKAFGMEKAEAGPVSKSDAASVSSEFAPEANSFTVVAVDGNPGCAGCCGFSCLRSIQGDERRRVRRVYRGVDQALRSGSSHVRNNEFVPAGIRRFLENFRDSVVGNRKGHRYQINSRILETDRIR